MYYLSSLVVAIIHTRYHGLPAVFRWESETGFVLIIAVKGGDRIDTYHFSRDSSLNDAISRITRLRAWRRLHIEVIKM